MFDHQFTRGVKLHKMVTKCPRIRKSIMSFIKRIISLVHAESYNPATLKFMSISPAGEPDKMLVVLEAAEYMDKALVLPEVQPSDASYQLVTFVDSLYKAIVGYNGSIEGFFHICPELATITYTIANYIHDRWFAENQCDLRSVIVWDTYDWWVTKDLLITGNLNG